MSQNPQFLWTQNWLCEAGTTSFHPGTHKIDVAHGMTFRVLVNFTSFVGRLGNLF